MAIPDIQIKQFDLFFGLKKVFFAKLSDHQLVQSIFSLHLYHTWSWLNLFTKHKHTQSTGIHGKWYDRSDEMMQWKWMIVSDLGLVHNCSYIEWHKVVWGKNEWTWQMKLGWSQMILHFANTEQLDHHSQVRAVGFRYQKSTAVSFYHKQEQFCEADWRNMWIHKINFYQSFTKSQNELLSHCAK